MKYHLLTNAFFVKLYLSNCKYELDKLAYESASFRIPWTLCFDSVLSLFYFVRSFLPLRFCTGGKSETESKDKWVFSTGFFLNSSPMVYGTQLLCGALLS